jgi:hypothetical protein
MNKNIFTAVLSLLFVAGLCAAGISISQNNVNDTLREMRFHPKAIPKITAAYTHLSTIDAFFPIGKTKNAGIILNPLIKLDGMGIQAEKKVWWNSLSQEEIDLIKKEWLSDPDKMPTGDDSILTELMAYDHWDTSSSGVYADYLSTPAKQPIFSAPIPNLVDLQYLIKLRLARGIREGDMLPALKEARHLARLCQGQESLIATMIGVALLSIERKAYQEAVDQGILDKESWNPILEDDCKLARTLGFAGVGIYIAQDDGDSLKQVQDLNTNLFAKCSTLSEAGVYLLTRHIIQGRWFAEARLFTPVPRFETTWNNSGCPLTVLRRYWSNSDFAYDGLSKGEVTRFSTPYLRTHILSALLTMGPFVPDSEEEDPLRY